MTEICQGNSHLGLTTNCHFLIGKDPFHGLCNSGLGIGGLAGLKGADGGGKGEGLSSHKSMLF